MDDKFIHTPTTTIDHGLPQLFKTHPQPDRRICFFAAVKRLTVHYAEIEILQAKAQLGVVFYG